MPEDEAVDLEAVSSTVKGVSSQLPNDPDKEMLMRALKAMVMVADVKGDLEDKIDEEELYDQCKKQMDAGVPRDKAIKRAVDASVSLASIKQSV